ncbi:MAG: GTP-binding protein, partial [Pseudonocardiaceae bacterium]
MGSRNYPLDTSSLTISAKIVVAGGFGVGKTTSVGSVSEIAPLNTEAWMTEAGEGVDPVDPGSGKTTTTVAMDFGRVTLHPDLVLYLFGTPGQARFWFLWDDLCRGALGAVVLVDTRRIQESFAAINYFENDSDVPFIVAVNMFDGQLAHDLDEVREALALAPEVPLT